ncbi:MAG TPA: hypothetical protein VNO70_06335 [Blastocatellia bacterium]|nr:hypothetical protein [Blastocatellia bacterium]
MQPRITRITTNLHKTIGVLLVKLFVCIRGYPSGFLRRIVGCAFVIFLLVAAPIAAQLNTQQENDSDQVKVGIPFETKDQRTFVGLGKTTWWTVTLILPDEYYSKENLERIFQYYSEKYPEKRHILRVSVYADEETYQRHLNEDTFYLPGSDPRRKHSNGEAPKRPARETWNIPHAMYERLCYNEFYYYSPDLENPEKRETVILNGETQTLTVIPHDCQ